MAMMNRIDGYLLQCQVPNPLVENVAHTPPSPEEVQQLIAYLRSHRVNPVVVGSVGIMHHLTLASHKFRPTVDLDLFVDKPLPNPPKGWRRDAESPGLTSWISPSGGYVDFMEKDHEFPSGSRNPSSVEVDPNSKDYPVASPVALLKLKLNSYREKDMSDAVALARAMGGVPDDAAFGKLNQDQKENLEMLRQWAAHFRSE
jgi:hypothetical protein